ncbi:LysR substrate-binding domain-containing protein [Nonomuraea dietziae]
MSVTVKATMTPAGRWWRIYFDSFATRHPGCDVRHRHLDFGNPFGRLRTGEADLAIVWLPVEERDLTVGPVVFTEPVVLAMSATHPLAARVSVSPARWALVWRSAAETCLIRDFAEIVHDLGPLAL